MYAIDCPRETHNPFVFQAQGVNLPEAGEKRPRPGTRVRPKKKKEEKSEEQGEHTGGNIECKETEVKSLKRSVCTYCCACSAR